MIKFVTVPNLYIKHVIYIILMFFEKIHSVKMSQQPIWQIICNSSNKKITHTHRKALHMFLESNYKLIPWLKKLEKVNSLSFICASSGISILIKLRHWIPNPGVLCSKPLGGSKVDPAFHPSEVDKMSTKNFWELSGKK